MRWIFEADACFTKTLAKQNVVYFVKKRPYFREYDSSKESTVLVDKSGFGLVCQYYSSNSTSTPGTSGILSLCAQRLAVNIKTLKFSFLYDDENVYSAPAVCRLACA